MSLPIRTTLEDADTVCKYLITKPTGATRAEARAVVDRKVLDGRKLTALKYWGFIEEDGDKLKITERGRLSVRDDGSYKSNVLSEVIREIEPYASMVQRAAHNREDTMSATEVAALWHEHFNSYVSESDKILNDQAVCFFQIAQGADLGTLMIGRRGLPTRFEFDLDATLRFVNQTVQDAQHSFFSPYDESTGGSDDVEYEAAAPEVNSDVDDARDKSLENNRVFITHGKHLGILEQVKEVVEFGKYEPVVAMEHETTAKPVPQKVMDDMRSCWAAVIHVSSDGVLFDEHGNEIPQINGNVLIEIGAAMALYGDKFILLVEEGLMLPSNLQGLYECRYKGDELSWATTRKLLKAFNEF